MDPYPELTDDPDAEEEAEELTRAGVAKPIVDAFQRHAEALQGHSTMMAGIASDVLAQFARWNAEEASRRFWRRVWFGVVLVWLLYLTWRLGAL